MNPENNKNTSHLKTILIVILLIVITGLVGWQMGNSKDSRPATQANTNRVATDTAANADVKALVSYNLPDGWTEGTCQGAAGKVYLIPNGTKLDCSANPSSPVKLYVDQQSTTDCNQLANPQNVRRHVCISLYINDHKSLKASTEYSQSSSVSPGSTVSAYYINTGRGVVKVEYDFSGSNSYQESFDQLATSVKVKG